MPQLQIEALTPEAFADFGAVISADAAREAYAINQGTTLRFHALATVDLEGGQAAISLGRAQPVSLPLQIRLLERHPLGSQAFIPLAGTRFLIVVAASPEDPPRAFLADRGEGIQYHRGCWHHPLLALDQGGDFLIVDRIGPGDNCEEVTLTTPWQIDHLPL